MSATTRKSMRSSLLLVLAVIIALNVAGRMYFGRADVTEGNIYTLSDYSRQLVAGMEDKITVKVFFSEDLGPQYNQNRIYLRDMLEDFQAYSNGRFRFEMVNPREKEAFEAEAGRYRIQPMQAQVLEDDQLTVKMVYMGLVFLAGDKTETIPVLGDVNGLEYTLTSTLKRLTQDELPLVGVIQGHGEPSLDAPMQNQRMMPAGDRAIGTVRQLLEQNYRVQPVELGAVDEIDPAMNTLLWISPQEEVATADLYKIDQFLMRGGRLGLFLDKVEGELQTQQATPISVGELDDFLAHLGIRVNEDLVGDVHCGAVQVRQQGARGLAALIPISMRYPLFVEVLDFNEDHAISRDLENAMLAFPSSLDTAAFAAARSMGMNVQTIARSSDMSEVQTGPRYDLQPMDRMDEQAVRARFNAGPQTLAISMEGAASSYFTGKDLPEGTVEGAQRLDQGVETRIAMVADGDFACDGYAQQGNLLLVQNIVDWLSLDEGLIGIRGKTITTRPLDDLSAGQRKFVKWLNILLPPIVIILLGVGRWLRRRRRADSTQA